MELEEFLQGKTNKELVNIVNTIVKRIGNHIGVGEDIRIRPIYSNGYMQGYTAGEGIEFMKITQSQIDAIQIVKNLTKMQCSIHSHSEGHPNIECWLENKHKEVNTKVISTVKKINGTVGFLDIEEVTFLEFQVSRI